MKKAIYNRTGMKQIIDSGYKLFDNQTNCIGTGNMISNTQYSSYIRPYKEVKNYGYIGKEGEFLDYDMQNFRHVNSYIIKTIRDKERTESVILYEFRVWKNGEKDIIGHVLTDEKNNLICYSINTYYGQKWVYKRELAIMEAMKYICN